MRRRYTQEPRTRKRMKCGKMRTLGSGMHMGMNMTTAAGQVMAGQGRAGRPVDDCGSGNALSAASKSDCRCHLVPHSHLVSESSQEGEIGNWDLPSVT